MDTSGAIAGSLTVFILFWFFGINYSSIILLSSILAFLSLIPLFFVKENTRERRNLNLKLGIKILPLQLKLFIFTASIFYLANFSYMFFILKVQESSTPSFSPEIAIFLYIIFNIFYALFSLPSGLISDRVGRRKVIISGYSLFSFTSLGFAFFDSLSSFLVLFALYGMSYAMVDGNQRAFISDLSSEEIRATALGTFHTFTGFASMPASLIEDFCGR